jgi:hypothetical protein
VRYKNLDDLSTLKVFHCGRPARPQIKTTQAVAYQASQTQKQQNREPLRIAVLCMKAKIAGLSAAAAHAEEPNQATASQKQRRRLRHHRGGDGKGGL